MADVAKRLSTNIDGNFFVDATCINCDTCRQLAPKSFVENGEYSSVYRQPETESERYQAYQALLACPVGSIGALVPDKAVMRAATESFPMLIEDNVFYNGFDSEKSFGANSYVIRHPEGNWLVDAPRYMKKLVDAFERMGGIAYIFLTHEDDTGDHIAWDREINGLRLATVYVWKESALRRSAEKLLEYPFEWILPGHGDRMHLPAARMREELRLLLARRAARASLSAP